MFFFIFSYLLFSTFFFFFNDTATTEIYTLSLHDALPILSLFLYFDKRSGLLLKEENNHDDSEMVYEDYKTLDRKSTRLNSSHSQISYAVFCLKKKKKT